MQQHSLFPSGTVLRQLRKVAEKRAGYEARQAQPFTSTNRYFRGRIVDLLRAQPAGQRVSLTELGLQIKPDFRQDELSWLMNLFDAL